MKPKSFSNTYQVFNMHGQYCGVDTCDVTENHRFDFLSHLSEVRESLCVNYREDSIGLLKELTKKISLVMMTM